MAHRLIASTRRVDSVLKNGLLTGNFYNLAQVQPRYSDFRQFLSQSSVYFSYEPPKFDRPVGPRESKYNGPAKMKGVETAEKKNIGERTFIAFSTSLRMSAPKALNQVSKLGGTGVGRDRERNSSRGPASDDEFWEEKFSPAFFLTVIISILLYSWCYKWDSSFDGINWKEFLDYLSRQRVAKVEVTKEKTFRVQPSPGTSIEFTETLRVTIENLESAENVAPETENLETKVEHKNEAPAVVHKKKARK